MWRPDRTADVLTDGRICEPVISLQEDPCTGDVLCSVCALRNELLEFSTFFVRKIDSVLLSAHSRDTCPEDITQLSTVGTVLSTIRFYSSLAKTHTSVA